MLAVWTHLRFQAGDAPISDAMVAAYCDNRGLGVADREWLSDVLVPFDWAFRRGARKLHEGLGKELHDEGVDEKHEPGAIRPLPTLPEESP